MDFESAKKIIEDIYSNIDGHAISHKARKKLNYTDKTLIYGEILLDSFYKILKNIKPIKNGVLYDLGSGVGKAIFFAYLLFPFKKSIGIESIPDIYQGAIQANKNFEEKYKSEFLNLNKQRKIEFINKNIFDVEYSKGDIIFIHATCFPDALMIPISKKLENLKKGAKVIVVTRLLYSNYFFLYKSEVYQMGWGQALVNFYEKIK